MKITLSLLVLWMPGICILSSCKKEPGEGGNSTITGRIYTREYDLYFTFLLAEYWAADEDLYIIYGDVVTSNDRVRTGPNGDFVFPYLRKGHYRVYVYSGDSTMTSQSGKVTLFRDVEITKNRQTIDVGTIVILKN